MKRIDAIVLAAGASRRMGPGRQKLLMDMGGQPMVRRVVEAALQSATRHVIVVTGKAHEAIARALAGLEDLQLVQNPDASRGMLSSVRCGLDALDPAAEGVAVLLGDQPGISAKLIDAVVHAWQRSDSSIALPTHAGRRGHPLVFDIRYRDEVMSAFDDVGLRGLLGAHSGAVLEVPVDSPEVVEDVDTPIDYTRAQNRLTDSHRS